MFRFPLPAGSHIPEFVQNVIFAGLWLDVWCSLQKCFAWLLWQLVLPSIPPPACHNSKILICYECEGDPTDYTRWCFNNYNYSQMRWQRTVHIIGNGNSTQIELQMNSCQKILVCMRLQEYNII